MDAVSKKERRLTNSKADDLWPVGSPDGKRIAFVSNRDGNQEIYVMDADGTRQTRLTMTQADEEDPVWSPDGKQIAFVSERDKNREIYMFQFNSQLSTLNSQLFRLTTHPATDELPAWSPDGDRISFVSYRDGNPEIYLLSQLSTLNSQLTRLTDHPANDGQDSHVWSPDGKQIAFVSERDGNLEIYLMEADGSDQRNLTQDPASDDGPAWSPILSGGPCAPPSADAPIPPDPAQPLAKLDGCFGHRIAFISDRDGDFEIYVLSQLSTLNSQLTRLTHAPGSDLWPVWSPIISGGPCGSENRPPMPPGDSNVGPLRFADANPHMPHTRRGQAEPDPRPAQLLAKLEGCFGSQIAFISERDGNPEIYVMQADGTNQRRMTHTIAEEKWVSWIK